MASSGSRPYYGTIWFNVLATAAAIFLLVVAAASLPDIQGRPIKSIGQFGVVLVAIYWIFVFPKLRKIRRNREYSEQEKSEEIK